MQLKNITILGPRGNVGTAIINQLLKSPDRFNITGISRLNSTYTPPHNSAITAKTVDYNSFDDLKAAFANQDAVVNCITGGATQYDPTKLIIDAAVAAGVKFYFANEYVGPMEREQYRRLPEAFVGSKVRIRAYLEGLAKEGKIAWTALNGGPFFEMWVMRGPAGFDIPNRQARIYGTGDVPLRWTPLLTIAQAATNMLLNPTSVQNRSIFISPIPGLTQNKLVAALEAAIGTKFTTTNIDVALINKNARIALERGEPGKAMKGFAVSNQFYEEEGEASKSADEVQNELVGVKEMEIEEAVQLAIETYGLETPVVEGMFRVEPCEV